MALRTLESIERRMRKQPSLKEESSEIVETAGTGWYLPHHSVITEAKNTKLRIVFDSSAKCEGISFNDLVEKGGPCLLNDLTGILLRFQRFEVGIAGDILKMFLRVLLHAEDCKYHSFLWQTDTDKLPDT